MKWLIPAALLPFILTACIFIEPDSKDVAAVTAYNNNLYQLLTPLVGSIVTFLGFVGLWIKSNADKREVNERTERAAEMLAMSAQERNNRLVAEVRETKVINETAIQAANNYNEKLMAVQQQVAENTKRAPARATDAVEHVQKVEIISGAGVDEPLKVHEEKNER